MHSLQDDRSGRVLGPCQVQREEGPGICHFPVFVVWMAYHRAKSVHHLGPGGRGGEGRNGRYLILQAMKLCQLTCCLVETQMNRSCVLLLMWHYKERKWCGWRGDGEGRWGEGVGRGDGGGGGKMKGKRG